MRVRRGCAVAAISLGCMFVGACNAILGNDAIVVWDGGTSATGEGGVGTGAPSCMPGGEGLTNCGAAGNETCCASLLVDGGDYDRTYDDTADGGIEVAPDGGAVDLGDPAKVTSLRLDKYEVTVGRFRQFVSAWANGWIPPAGSGKHTHLNGGNGLANSGSPGTFESGWSRSDNGNVAPTSGNLACDGDATWTSSANEGHENLPVNCVNWWESYAFCIWDDAFLPSESEWEYAAAGGSLEREYPWGSADPGSMSAYAIYGNGADDCYYPSDSLAACVGVANIAPVGSPSLGAGKWGQLDLAGNVWEWALDFSAPYVDPCQDCAYLVTATNRAVRGGDFYLDVSYLRASRRGGNPPSYRGNDIGLRCARTP